MHVVRTLLLCLLVLVMPVGCRADERPATVTAQTVAALPTTASPKHQKLVIKEAILKLRTPAPDGLVPLASTLAQRHGGYVVSSDTARIDASVTKVEVALRVRVEDLDLALAELRKLGDVLQETVTGEDVTEEFVDVQARVKAKRVLEERLLAIASGAQRVEDMLKVETELSRVRGEIEQLEGRSKLLQDRARLSLIRVSAVSPSQPDEPGAESVGSRLKGAFGRAWSVAVDVLVGLIVVVGGLLPLALGLCLLLVPIVIVYRRRRRARPE